MTDPIDKSNMRRHILEFPEQFSTGYEAAENTGEEFSGKKIGNIVVAGMGGSALPGLLLQMLGPKVGLKNNVLVRRNYMLPAQNNSLVVVISYSGNTEEALSVYKDAKRQGLSLAAVTTGGKLAELAKQDNTPVAKIPGGLPPRMGMGCQFAALVKIVENVGLLDSQKKLLDAIAISLDPDELENKGKKMAEELGKATPLFYASDTWAALAYIMKIQMNENAKRHAFINTFPELNHNEIAGFEDSDKKNAFQTYILRADDDNDDIRKRMQLTADILQNKGYDASIIDIVGESLYNKVFETVLLGAWFSYYVAIKNGVDPTPTEIIEEFKKQL